MWHVTDGGRWTFFQNLALKWACFKIFWQRISLWSFFSLHWHEYTDMNIEYNYSRNSTNFRAYLILIRWSRSRCCSKVCLFSSMNISMIAKAPGIRKGFVTQWTDIRAFLLCVFCSDFLDVPTGKKTCHMRGKQRAFLLCVFWYGLPDGQTGRKSYHTACMSTASLPCEFWHVSAGFLHQKKVFSHWWQVKGFSPVCILMWLFRCAYWVKDLPHEEQVKGLYSMCVLWWVFRFPDWLKAWSHWRQEEGFSPVWILIWMLKTFDRENDFVHLEQM